MTYRVVTLNDRGDYIEAVLEDDSPAGHWIDIKCGNAVGFDGVPNEFARTIVNAHTIGGRLELVIAQ